jgi:hypothetical protein
MIFWDVKPSSLVEGFLRNGGTHHFVEGRILDTASNDCHLNELFNNSFNFMRHIASNEIILNINTGIRRDLFRGIVSPFARRD